MSAQEQTRELLLKQLLVIEGGQNLLDVETLDAPLRAAVQLHNAQTNFNGATLSSVPRAQRDMSPLDVLLPGAFCVLG